MFVLRSLSDSQALCRGRDSSQIVFPCKHQITALARHGIKSEEWIGGNGGMQRGTEDFFAVVGAAEGLNDVPGNFPALVVQSEAGLHRMLDHGTDLDDLAAPGTFRYAHTRCPHAAHSPRSDVTTATFTVADQTVSSLMTATAVM